MIRSIVHAILCSMAIVGQAPVSQPPADNSARIPGYWRGQLQMPSGSMNLTIGLNVTRGDDGKLSATLDSPDQGALDIPVATITLTGQMLRADVTRIGGVYEATLQADKDVLVGEWRQGGATLPLTLERRDPKERTTVKPKPQEPTKPYPYAEEAVKYQNAKAGVTLGGTLTLPKASQRVPAVLLLSGSGPQDRDESLMGHRPFLVLADHLTRQGIAVLRVDDRGVGDSTGRYNTSTLFDLADDAVAGVEFLAAHKAIDPERIGIIGHSEGGAVGPLAATKSARIHFLVLMAGPGMIGEDILYAQGAALLQARGTPSAALANQRTFQERTFAVLKQEPDAAAAAEKLRAVIRELYPGAPDAQRTTLEASIETMNQPWFRAFLTYDPRPTLRKVTCPVLALLAEKDLQVPARENAAGIEEALKAGGNKDFSVKVLPGLNHLFQTATTGLPMEYARIDETIAPAALQAITDWIRAHTAR